MLQLGIRGLGIARFKFNPISWFLKGESGAWYDPSDFQPNWRRNLLTWSEDFSNAVWTKPNSSVVGGFIAPDGSLTANSLTGTGVGVSWIRHDVISPSVVCTISYRVKADTSSFFAIGDVNIGHLGSFNLITGVPTGTGTSMLPLENSWYLCSVTYNSIAGYSRHVVNPSATYTGITTLSVLIWHPQIENSSSPSEYQKITDGIQDYYAVQPKPVLFQDSAGTIPVTAVEQPVGLMLDKSRGLALGAELVTKPYITGGTGWIVGSDYLDRNGSSAALSLAVFGVLPVGRYKIAFTASNMAVDTFTIAFAGSPNVGSITSNGDKSFYINVASPTTAYLQFIPWGGGGGLAQLLITNISVKQIAGNHAFQATAGNRPVLSARANILLATATLSTQSVTSLATNYTLAFTGAGTVTLSGTATGVLSAGSNTFTATAGTLTLTVSGSVTHLQTYAPPTQAHCYHLINESTPLQITTR